MSTERPTRTVAATVLTKAEAKDGYKLELEIPEFESAYPTVVTRVPAKLADALKVGTVYNLVLEQQNLKRGKTGERPYDYYWGLVGVAAGAVAAPPASPQVHVGTKSDDTRTSIERQKALDVAERFYSRFAPQEPGITFGEHAARLLGLAQELALWLESGKAPVVASRPASALPRAHEPPLTAEMERDADDGQQPPPNLGAFMDWARRTYGYESRPALCAAMDVGKVGEIIGKYETWPAAVAYLEAQHQAAGSPEGVDAPPF